MISGIDSRQILYLPGWTKVAIVLLFVTGMAASLGVVIQFIGREDGADWLLIGISGVQFGITALAAVFVLFFSETHANIRNLEKRSESFLRRVVPEMLARITFPGMVAEKLTVECGERRDIFGYDFVLRDAGTPVFRLWCGLNVNRLIVIYFMENPRAEVAQARFVGRLEKIFAFSLGGAKSAGYELNFEPLPDQPNLTSVWVCAVAAPDLLTDSGQKLYWSQDIAMMTESVFRTARRHKNEVQPSLATIPAPL